jgi:hypothetical protein
MAFAEIVCQNPADRNGCNRLKLLALKVSLKNVLTEWVWVLDKNALGIFFCYAAVNSCFKRLVRTFDGHAQLLRVDYPRESSTDYADTQYHPR